VKLLLDSHVLLWWLEDPLLITPVARRTIANPENVVFFSVASVWEISIKAGLGKLTVPPGWTEALLADGFETLVIDTAHALAVQHLPAVHHDPFDRLLIAQSRVEGLTLLSRDRWFASYEINLLPA
jgi:PIN domain nuclease of toxin-antitoxin system